MSADDRRRRADMDMAAYERKRIESGARFGDTGWGFHASATDHHRYALAIKSRRRCPFHEGRLRDAPRVTHAGQANGLTLMNGCEWHVRQWVRDPHRRLRP